jgi:trimethylamine corrinoid protein
LSDESGILKRMNSALQATDEKAAEAAAKEAVEAGIDPVRAVEEGFAPAIRELGDKFERMEIFLPQLVMAANAMKAGLMVLEQAMKKAGTELKYKGSVVLGTVEGDIHDIGKTIVGAMLSSAGYKVHDLGIEVPITRFLETAEEIKADIIASSALLSTTMIRQKEMIEFLSGKSQKDKYIIIVGGAPVTQKWADEIGADGYAEDAVKAVRVLNELMDKRK